MRKSLALVFTLLLLPQLVLAWGGGGGGNSAPAFKSTPKRTYTPPPAQPKAPPEQQKILTTLSYYVQFRSVDGLLPVPDPEAEDREWHLKMSAAPVLNKVDASRYHALVPFEGTLGDDTTNVPVVLDFDMAGSGDKWAVKNVRIHSVNGVERADS